MAGRQEVTRQRFRLDATFVRIASVDGEDLEARADFTKYLCVRVSGYLESSIAELLRVYAVEHGSPEVSNFVAADLRRFQNAKRGKILELFGKFDKHWEENLKIYLVDEKADALGTIVSNRHKIAHGDDSTLSFTVLKRAWEEVKEIVDYIADLIDPP